MAGIVQLVSKGVEDIYITENPEVTNFRFVYRRHANFAKEIQRNSFTEEPNFGAKYTCTISKNGDMINKMGLSFTLPSINLGTLTNDTDLEFAWCAKTAFVLAKSVELEIGSVLIDKHYGDWMNIWYELVLPLEKRIDLYIGLDPLLNEYSRAKSTFNLFVPLAFWFNIRAAASLPIMSLQNQDIKINIDLRHIKECIKFNITNQIQVKEPIVTFMKGTYIKQIKNGKIKSLGIFIRHDIETGYIYYEKLQGQFCKEYGPILDDNCNFITIMDNVIEQVYCNNINFHKYSLTNTFIYCEYIFLDRYEKLLIIEKGYTHHLMTQVLFGDEKIIYENKSDLQVRFLGLCRELVWVTQTEDALLLKDYFNYGNNILKKEEILINSIKRPTIKDAQYYYLLQPYMNHQHTDFGCNINNYSFSLYPEEMEPSGIINLQKISNFNFRLTLNKKMVNRKEGIMYFRSYARVYNVFKIENGYGTVLFNNNVI